MHKLLLFIFLFSLCLKAPGVYAQSEDSASGVTVHADPRLDSIVVAGKTTGTPGPGGSGRGGSIHSAKGFRVQIYGGPDRGRATQVKIDFLRRFPSVRSYLSYISPKYVVKVGDFRTRDEASHFYSLLSNYYNPCIIVPDIVEINTFHND